jgi:hypothetical protein
MEFSWRAQDGSVINRGDRLWAYRRGLLVKLEREGNVFRAYLSYEGRFWFRFGPSVVIPMSEKVYLGMQLTQATQ